MRHKFRWDEYGEYYKHLNKNNPRITKLDKSSPPEEVRKILREKRKKKKK